MNHVVRGISDPDFGLPCDFVEILSELPPIETGGYENKSHLAISEEVFQFCQTLWAYRAVTCYRLNKNQPVLLLKMHDDIWHLSMFFDRKTQ